MRRRRPQCPDRGGVPEGGACPPLPLAVPPLGPLPEEAAPAQVVPPLLAIRLQRGDLVRPHVGLDRRRRDARDPGRRHVHHPAAVCQPDRETVEDVLFLVAQERRRPADLLPAAVEHGRTIGGRLPGDLVLHGHHHAWVRDAGGGPAAGCRFRHPPFVSRSRAGGWPATNDAIARRGSCPTTCWPTTAGPWRRRRRPGPRSWPPGASGSRTSVRPSSTAATRSATP